MAMSRRKQLHPKSLKEGDETTLVLPDELKCDEESNEIIARIDIEEGHRFGPFAATATSIVSSDSDSTMIMQIDNDTIEQRTQTFQLLDIKHNWLSRCSISSQSAANLDVQFQDDQIIAIVTKSIPNGTRLNSNSSILPKLNHCDDLQTKQDTKTMITNSTDETIKIKEEPIESDEKLDLNSMNLKAESPNSTIKSRETKKSHLLVFTCEDCGIRYSNRSTLDAHREHYCTKRETTKSHSTDSSITTKLKSMKRKHNETTDSSSSTPSPNKRLSLSSNDAYCSECDILFSKPDNLLQHKLHYCRTKLSNLQPINEENLTTTFRPTIPFDRPIQIGQFIYVPVPIVPSKIDNRERSISPNPSEHDEQINQQNKPLDLSKPKKTIDETKSTNLSSSPLDLTMEKSTNLFNILNSTTTTNKTINSIQQQIYECDFCSIRFSSLKTLHAHQENYCIEYRKQKKPSILNNSINEMKCLINDTNRSQSPPLSSSTISKSLPLSPNESTNSSHLPPHRASPYMCRLCKYRGNTLRGMRMHFKFHLSNNEPCSDDDIIITSTLNSNNNNNNNNNNTNLLISNTSSSSTPFLLKCTICSAMFEHEEPLVNHIKCVHTKENLLECLECQSRFCSKWNLLRHMKLTHTNMKCDDDDEQQQQQQQQDEHSITTNESQSNSDQNSDEDRDLSSPNEKSSGPVNLTRNVLLESMDINSIKKLSDNLLSKKKFACPYCHIKFGGIDILKQHMTNYCSSRPTNDELNETKKKSNDTFCSSCQIPFRHKSSYDAHKMYYCRGSNKAHVKMQA